ncbi:MAG: hypothetical protein IJA34_06740 [Lachnospiraceae bacterium]|nr:hypothetical protein [Lachnospiraceae bacterium]
MILILISYILLLFDPMPKNFYFDLLPDYFGYVFIIIGYYRMTKVLKENKEAIGKIKYAVLVSIVMFIFSYAFCLFGMFGKLNNLSKISALAIDIASDVGEIVFIYFYINILEKIQEDKTYFQIKSMKIILLIITFCDLCMYISCTKPLTYSVFLVFELMASMMFMAYLLSSHITYRNVFIKKKIIVSANNNKNITKKATGYFGQKKETNNFKNVKNTKKIKKGR